MNFRMSRRSVLHSSTLKNCLSVHSSRHQSKRNQSFACSLIKKLNQVAARNRVIQRHVRPLAAGVLSNRRCRVLHHIGCDENLSGMSTSTCSEKVQSFDSTFMEDVVPQEEWDDLYEKAFQAIEEGPVDFLD